MYPNNTPWPGQHNRPSSGMGYLMSISPSQEPEMSGSTGQESTGGLNVKRIIVVTVIMIAVVAVLATVVIIASGSIQKVEDDGITTAKEHEREETLNKDLEKLIENDPNRSYDSPNDYSPNYGAVPSEVISEWDIDVNDMEYSSTFEVDAMNSNILNYYLDNEKYVVAIEQPSGIRGRDKQSNAVVIFASIPSSYDFVGFMPADFNSDGSCKNKELLPEETTIYFTRSELFNQLTADAKFYVIKKR